MCVLDDPHVLVSNAASDFTFLFMTGVWMNPDLFPQPYLRLGYTLLAVPGFTYYDQTLGTGSTGTGTIIVAVFWAPSLDPLAGQPNS